MTIEYFYITPYVDYNAIFEESGCKKGNLDELLRIVKMNPAFCRNQKAIGYNYFTRILTSESVIYITDNEGVSYNNYIVGACAIRIDKKYTDINIIGLCVPFSSDKKYGTLLINKVKDITKKLGFKTIMLGAKDSNKEFYEKNGFFVTNRSKPEIYNRRAPDSEIDYDVDMSFTFNDRGGRRKIRKTNKKRKYKSKTRRFKRY
jgi:GNAT superfamily N-acetyltransferase